MRLLCIVLLAVLPTAIFAQTNYHQGYILKNNGDTLKGYIDYKEWAQCPTSINFKVNKEDGHKLKFDPYTIKRFQVNGLETYVTYKGIISMDRTKFPDLPLGLDTSKKLDTVFLKQIVTGKHLTLFSHQDDTKTRFFVAENGQIIELKYYQYYNAENQPIEKDSYKGQLLFYINEFMPGNDKLNKEVNGLIFNEGDLAKIVSEINGNINSVQKKSFFRLFVGLGLNSTKTELNDNTHQIEQQATESTITYDVVVPLHVTKYSTTVSPNVNFGIDFFSNPTVQRLVFRAELNLSYAKTGFQYDIYDGKGNSPLNYSYNQYSSTLTPQILYNIFNKNNFKFYIDGGIGLNFSNYINNKGTKSNDMNSFWPSFPVQTGIVLNRQIEFSVTYSAYSNLTPFGKGPYNIQYKSMNAGFKYLFGSK